MESQFGIPAIIERFQERQIDYYLHYNLYSYTDQDIQFLEHELDCQLPATYVQFLKWAGKSSANIFTVTNARYTYGSISWMQKMAREIMQWDRTPPTLLPDDAIIISVDGQDSGFDFFRLGEGDNPPVYYYLGISDQVKKGAESFTAYLGELLIESARVHRIEEKFDGGGEAKNLEDIQRLLRQFISLLMNQFFVGCTKSELNRLEKKLGITLPVSYKTFLQACGREAAVLWVGKSWRYDDIVKIQRYPQEILQENNIPLTLPSSAFICVFYSEGSGFTFFNLNEGEDPPVYEFLLQSPELGFVQVANRFSEFLEQETTSIKYPITSLTRYCF